MAIVWLQLPLLICLTSTMTSATVSIHHNGYEGIEIVIHEDVPEDSQLLDIIQVRKVYFSTVFQEVLLSDSSLLFFC